LSYDDHDVFYRAQTRAKKIIIRKSLVQDENDDQIWSLKNDLSSTGEHDSKF